MDATFARRAEALFGNQICRVYDINRQHCRTFLTADPHTTLHYGIEKDADTQHQYHIHIADTLCLDWADQWSDSENIKDVEYI